VDGWLRAGDNTPQRSNGDMSADARNRVNRKWACDRAPDQEEQRRQFKERCAVRRVGDSDAASAHEIQFERQAPGNSEAGIAASSGTVVGSSGLIVPQNPAGAGIQNWPSATNTGFPAMPS
jgi:hypothetical protein